MSTNLQIITDALRMLGVLDETETPSAEQGMSCLRQLNGMMDEWGEDGIDLPYFSQTSTADVFPCPEYSERAVSSALAIRVAPIYRASITQELLDSHVDGMSVIRRKSVLRRIQTADLRHVPMGDVGGRANIETDQ